MKNWISTLIDTSDQSGFVEYGLIVAILATVLFGAFTANGDDRAAVPPRHASEAARHQGAPLTDLGLSFDKTPGEHRE